MRTTFWDAISAAAGKVRDSRRDDDDKKGSSRKPRATKSPKPTPTPTPKSTRKSTPKPKPTKSATPKPTPTKSVTPKPTPTKSATPKPTPTKASTPTPTRSSTGPTSTSKSATTSPSSTAPSPRPTSATPSDDDGEERDYDSQADFASHQMQQDNPETLFRQTPHLEVNMDLSSRDLRFPDGAEFEMWVFHRSDSGRGFPGPTLRPMEKNIFHATVEPSMGPHTIHWHGMEPDPRNDGVGHTSFEIDDSYTYQWQPEPGRAHDPNYGAAGTYFYHCHVNTPLHAQMGLLGPLVIDPIVLPEFPVSPGNRRAFADGPEYDIATESLIMPFSIDPRWHEMGHAAGLSGEDVGLNRFEPTHFYITGGLLAQRKEREEEVWAPTQLPINVKGNGKAPSLMRFCDGNYLPNRITFLHEDGTPARIAELIAHDGRPFRHTSAPGQPAIPTSMHPDSRARLFTHTLTMGAAERYDMLLHPPAAGNYTLRIDWNDWITGQRVGRRELKLIAS
ncbi:multicopper oxidase domain-containing protein [Paeniglutamicibacter sp. ZC-3]|uniref:multicopper oxidase domain-containing protein n=1 Tax=Paeniglutamicibacter TaxID=1742990 RepID=UPI0021F77D1F|nr:MULTISPECIES: multicopper oxidase domain-containing protein [Paeniglutamicibacter]MCV9994060.1 multicopper oxidase domain-containing protein [Paeniglutamicibacter sp. ZC-3]MDO2935927.1 multicopper oxidase domain-containing protein [Paeniglutamicibacter sulfureus]